MAAPSALDYLDAPPETTPKALDFLDAPQDAVTYLNSPPKQPSKPPEWWQAGGSGVSSDKTQHQIEFFNEAVPGLREATSPGALTALGAGTDQSGGLQRIAQQEVMAPEEAADAVINKAYMTSPLEGTLPRPTRKADDSRMMQIAKGTTESLEGTVEGLTSPFNIMTMGGMKMLGPIGKRLASLGFATQMASHIPAQFKAYNEATNDRDRANAFANIVLGGTMTYFAGKEGVLGEPATPAELRERAAKGLQKLTPPSTPGEPKPFGDPAQLDGLHIARRVLLKDFNSQPPEVQKSRQEIIDNEIDPVLLAHDRDAIKASEARTAPQSGTIPLPEPPAAEGVAPSPQRQPNLFDQAKQEQVVAPVVEAATQAAQDGLPKVAEVANQIAETLGKHQPVELDPNRVPGGPLLPKDASKTSPPEEIAPEGKAAAEEPEAVEPPSEPGTRIVGPALVDANGQKVAEGKIGQSHKDLKQPFIDADNADAVDYQHRFVDDKGNVLDRAQAWDLAEKAGQISPEALAAQKDGAIGKELHSEHLTSDENISKPPVSASQPPETPVETPVEQRVEASKESGVVASDSGPVEEPAKPVNQKAVEEAHVKAYSMADSISKDVARGQSDSVQEAARLAAHKSAVDSINKDLTNLRFNPDFMRKAAREAAGKAKAREGESLDAEREEGGDSKHESTASDEDSPDVQAAKKEYAQKAVDSLSELTQREQEVVQRVSMAGETLEDVGKRMNLSKQRVQQIHAEALGKLKKIMGREGYEGGPGAMGPVEALEMAGKQGLVSIRNADVNERRAAEGKELLVSEERKSNPKTWAQTEAEFEKDPDVGKKLVDGINSGAKTSITDVEQNMLVHEMITAKNARDQWDERAGQTDLGTSERLKARERAKQYDDYLNQIDQAARTAGTQAGRALQIRKMQIRDDFTLAGVERRVRSENGDLSEKGEQVLKELKETAAKYQEELKRSEALEEEASEGKAFEEMAKIYEKLVNEVAGEAPKISKPVLKIAREIVDRWKSEANEARESLKGFFGSEVGAVGDVGGQGGKKLGQQFKPAEQNAIKSLAKVMRAHIAEVGLNFAEVSARILGEFSDKTKPYLDAAWKAAKALTKNERGIPKEDTKTAETGETKATGTKVKTTAQGKTKPKTVAQVKASLKADVTAGDGLNAKTLANLARAHIREGITGVDNLMKAVHQDVLEQFPDATEKDVRRALVKYGSEVAAPTRDEVEQQLAQLKSLVKVGEDIRNLEQNPPQPTWKSQRRQQHSDELRRLMKVRSELLKKADLPESETSLASRAKTRETALENRIKDIDHELQTGEKPPENASVTRTPREEDLMMERDALQEKLNEVRAEARPVRSEADLASDKAQQAVDRAAAALDRQQRINSGEITPEAKEKVQPLSDLEKELRDRTEELRQAKKVAEAPSAEEQAATAAQKGVDSAANSLERWNQILKGEIAPEGKTPKEAMSDLQEEMQSQIEAMKEAHRELEKQNKPLKNTSDIREKMQLKSLEKAIAEYERMAKEVDLESKGKRQGPDSAQVAKAKQARDAAKKVVDEMRKARKTVKTPEEQYNERRGKQVEKMIVEAQRKLATKDYAPKPKPAPLAQTAALAVSEAKLRKMRQDIQSDMDRIAYEKRSSASKVVASVAKLISGLKVVGHGTVGMITHAGAVWPRYDMQKIFWRNFGRQFGMWAKPEFHEQLIHQLTSDPEFEDWKNAGASIDPEKTYTDYGLYVNALKHLSEKGGKVGKGIANFLEGGQRGFDALKFARLEMNKAAWEKVPQEIKADPAQAAEMRRYIADMNNKATGSIPGKINPVGKDFEQGVYNIAKNPVVEVALFAPRLYASRWARIVIDPVKTSDTFRRMAMDKVTGQRTISPAQAEIAKIRLKNAAKFAAGYTAALAVNQAILSATGSDQKVNMTDPTKADWLKFKGFGKELVADGGLLDPVRLLGQVVIGDLIMDKKWRGEAGFKKAAVDLATYGRGKLSPSVGILADEATGRDFAGRPLPQGKTFFGLGTDIEDTIKKPKYGWGEWLSQQFTPIPVSGGVRVAYDEMRKEGMSHLDAVKMLKGAAMAALSFTGAHISEDHAQEMDQAEAKPGPKGTPRFSIRKRRAR